MEQQKEDIQIIETSALLTCYGFDLRGLTPQDLINEWLKSYSPLWIRWAVVEALYQGRYKAISVEHLLNFWSRRGEPSFRFSGEFERLITHNLPKSYTASLDLTIKPKDDKIALSVPPKFSLPSFPAPPPLLEPILNSVSSIISQDEPLEEVFNGSFAVEEPENLIGLEAANHISPLKTRSIDRFIPILDESDLLGKLRMVVRRELAQSMA
ncbi:MAG: hypothetical protein ACKO2V_24915 [Snowella sp.]